MRTHFSINGLDLVGFVVEGDDHFALLDVAWWRNDTSRRSLLVLYRQAGVKSNQETALQSAHCPSCGAPEESQATDACASCGQVTNTGKYGWVLANFIEDRTSLNARSWRRRLTPAHIEIAPEDTTGLRSRVPSPVIELTPADCLRWAIAHLTRDGGLTHIERVVLAKCAARNRIAAVDFERWVERAQEGSLTPPSLDGDLGAEECLDQVVGCVLHDGRIRGDARALLIRLAEMVELPDYDVALAARKQAYRKRVA